MLSRLAVGPRVASRGPRLEASIRGCGEQVWDGATERYHSFGIGYADRQWVPKKIQRCSYYMFSDSCNS